MRSLLYASLLLLTACKDQVDVDAIERREHGLSYVKGTNKLVNGEVIRRFDNGKIAELKNYKNGKAIGDCFVYGYQGEIVSHGFNIDAKRYEAKLPNTDLTYATLSIDIEDSSAFAALYLDNQKYFDDTKLLLGLSREIFAEYSNKYKIKDILFYDKTHQCTISKNAVLNGNYKIDTIYDKEKQVLFVK